MIKRYAEFLAENVQKSKAIIAKRMADYESLKERLTRDNTLGYLGKLTELLFLGAPVADLSAAYERLLALRRANMRVDIDGMDTLEKIQDALEERERDLRVRQVLSQIPPAQKQWFSGGNMTKSDLTLLDGMSRVNSGPFMRKVSQYKDKGTMLRMAGVFMRTAGQPADREHFRGLAGGGLKIVHEDDRLLIFHTAKVADLLKVGGDTAWCIKNEGTFKSYTSEGRTQYVLIDFGKDRFDPLFKVGFTLGRGGGVVAYAHDVLDKTCIPHLRDLLARSGVDPVALVNKTRTKVPPPDMTTADFAKIIDWMDKSGVLAEEAGALLKSFLRRPGLSRTLAAARPGGPVSRRLLHKEFSELLSGLFRPMSRGRYLTDQDLDTMVPPRSLTKAARASVAEKLRASGILLPKLDKINIRQLDDDKLFPYLHLIEHDVFANSDLERCVDDLLDILIEENRRAAPNLAEEVLRLIGLAGEARRPVLMAAWEKAVNGVTPELLDLTRKLDGTGDYVNKDKVLDLLGVVRPFDEESALSNWHAMKKNLIALPPKVTLTRFDKPGFRQVAEWLRKEGVVVEVRTDSERVLEILSDRAVWSSATGAYKPSSNRYSLPGALREAPVRYQIVRTKKRRFDWRPGTQFPIRFTWDSVPYTIEKKKETQ